MFGRSPPQHKHKINQLASCGCEAAARLGRRVCLRLRVSGTAGASGHWTGAASTAAGTTGGGGLATSRGPLSARAAAEKFGPQAPNAGVGGLLHQLERGHAVGTDAAELAVDVCRLHWELGEGRGRGRILCRPVESGAGEELDLAAF